jgi:hypothetical protein
MRRCLVPLLAPHAGEPLGVWDCSPAIAYAAAAQAHHNATGRPSGEPWNGCMKSVEVDSAALQVTWAELVF